MRTILASSGGISYYNSMKRAWIIVVMLGTLISMQLAAQSKGVSSAFKIARLKYSGGGDWYNDPQGEVNLLTFIKQQTLIDVEPVYEFTDLTSDKFFTYPFLFLTGHGNLTLSEQEVQRLRTYLENGGFLYADDDYGMDRPAIFPGPKARHHMMRHDPVKRHVN